MVTTEASRNLSHIFCRSYRALKSILSSAFVQTGISAVDCIMIQLFTENDRMAVSASQVSSLSLVRLP